MSNVFISYAREDVVFVRNLGKVLQDQEREAWVDLEGIYAGEEFWPKISSAIENADTFAFVISEHSVNSKYCRKELEHATNYNKRIIPLIRKEVNDRKVPKPLDSLQWIFFREQDDLISSLKLLIGAIDTDFEWVRTHTRLLVRTREWQHKKKNNDFVLRGKDLQQAEEWLSLASKHEQKPVLIQSQYITASRKVATQRLQIIIGAIFFGFVVAIILALLALNQRQKAIEQRKIAVNREKIALARKLAVQAEFTRNQRPNMLSHSVRLAVEATRRFNSVEAYQPLRFGLSIFPYSVMHKNYREEILDIIFSPNGEYLATRVRDTHHSGEPILIWNTDSGAEVSQIEGNDRWVDITFSNDGQYLHAASPETAIVWDIASKQEISRISHNGSSWGFYSKPAVFNYGGEYLASLQGSLVEIWNVSSSKAINRVRHEDKVELAVFSWDGKYLATASHDKTAIVWDVVTGQKIFQIEFQIRSTPFSKIMTPILFSRTNRYIATASGNTVKVYEVPHGKEISHINHSGQVTEIAFSKDGKYLATAGSDNAARIWEVSSGKQVELLYHADFVNSVAFSPDGKYLATGSRDGTGRVWKKNNQEVLRMSHKSSVQKIVYSQDGTKLATADKNRAVWLWKAEEGPGLVRITPFRVSNLRVSLNGPYLSTVVRMFSSKSVLVCDVANGKRIASFNPSNYSDISDFIFSPDGRLLATAAGWVAKIWEVGEKNKPTIIIHQGNIEYIDFSPDGRYLATATDDNTMWIWNASNGNKVIQKEYDVHIKSLQFTLDGKHIIIIHTNNTIQIFDLNSSREVATIPHEGQIKRIALSQDGKYIGTASNNGVVSIYEVPIGKLATRIYGTNVSILAFSKDGKRLIIASDDHTLSIWDISSGNKLQQFNYEGKEAGFSPDSKYLATVTQSYIRIWEIENGREIAQMNNETPVNALLFNSSGKYIVTATNGNDGEIRAWLWRPQNLIEEACNRLIRNFTHDEWLQHFNDEPYRKTCENLPIHPTLIKAARQLARSGDVDKAIDQFKLAIELDPDISFDPKVEAQRFAAKGLVDRGKALAFKGDVEKAIANYYNALELDPSLEIDPILEKRKMDKVASQKMLQKGNQFIKEGDIEEAITAFHKAVELDSDLIIEPSNEPKKVAKTAALGLVKKARNLAANGDVENAILYFQKALEYDSNLSLEPKKEAHKWHVSGLIEKGKTFAYHGKVKKAIEAYEKAQSLDPTLEFSAATWSHLCWNSSLFGYASDAITICNDAVEQSHKTNLLFFSKRSRGLARAMSGDLQGAMDDFQAILKLEKDEKNKSRYQKWIETLSTGENPFTPTELETLLYWKISDG